MICGVKGRRINRKTNRNIEQRSLYGTREDAKQDESEAEVIRGAAAQPLLVMEGLEGRQELCCGKKPNQCMAVNQSINERTNEEGEEKVKPVTGPLLCVSDL
jgi:hypothetical protein